ncbi:MAG: nucleotidyl transferase AbiEii/AbiGii toxin family protein [Thermodesulfobacteriota bacterium]|nr:nucleotidyl transferase AbiEii/AbiGii toxin family protein [Thermodesulfobacteriota bacterium]
MNEKKDPDLFSDFLEILNAFAKNGVEYILIGGFAVIIHGFPRLTSDIDIFLKPEAKNLERLKRALKKIFPNDKEIDTISLKDLQEYSVIRYGTENGLYIDILSKIGKMFIYEDIDFEIRTIKGIPVRLATAEALYKMKFDTLRPEDKRDAQFLAELIRNKNDRRE